MEEGRGGGTRKGGLEEDGRGRVWAEKGRNSCTYDVSFLACISLRFGLFFSIVRSIYTELRCVFVRVL